MPWVILGEKRYKTGIRSFSDKNKEPSFPIGLWDNHRKKSSCLDDAAKKEVKTRISDALPLTIRTLRWREFDETKPLR